MKRWIIWCAAAIAAAPQGVHAQFDGAAAAQLQKLVQAYRYVDAAYVDSLNPAPLVEEAIRGMLTRLDPHSDYLSADEMKEVDESFDGSFGGIGIEFNVLNDTVVVVNTIAGGPSAQAGLRPGDRIVAVDGRPSVGLTRAQVPKLLRGPSGTQVRLEVQRPAEHGRLAFTVTRGDIPLHTIDAAYKAAPATGYIKVNRFGRTTMEEFIEAFGAMRGIRSLILDLRGNGGGLLDQAVAMANFFLPRGSRIVSTEGRAVAPRAYTAPVDGVFLDGAVVVLIDENSASASEIVAGALQDWDRAVVMGRPSFGKGLVQRQFRLGDGSALRVTVARYHTPSGRVIQRPYQQGHREAYYAAHRERLMNVHADSTAVDAPLFETLRAHRPVRGGGGICPDVRVEADTLGQTAYWRELVRHGIINELVLRYIDRERERMAERWPDFESFDAGFAVAPETMQELAALAAARGIEPDAAEAAQADELLQRQIKALVAERLFPREGFFRVMNGAEGSMFRRAVELLEAWPERGKPLLRRGV